MSRMQSMLGCSTGPRRRLRLQSTRPASRQCAARVRAFQGRRSGRRDLLLRFPGDSPSDRASSDYDIRQTFSGAVSYNIPAPGSGIWKSIFGNWSTDSIVYARTAPPVNVVTGLNPFPGVSLSGASSVQRPNLVSGVPRWIANPNVAGGKEINPASFMVPAGAIQGDLGRNALRGFGATNVDLTLRRRFKLREGLALQARADLFN